MGCDEDCEQTIGYWWSESIVQCPYFLVIVDLLEQLDIIELMEVPVRTSVKKIIYLNYILLLVERVIYPEAIPKRLKASDALFGMLRHATIPGRAVSGCPRSREALCSKMPLLLFVLGTEWPGLALLNERHHDLQEDLLARDIS
jgi:hypothetical protein